MHRIDNIVIIVRWMNQSDPKVMHWAIAFKVVLVTYNTGPKFKGWNSVRTHMNTNCTSLEEPKHEALLIFIASTFHSSLCHIVTSLKSNKIDSPQPSYQAIPGGLEFVVTFLFERTSSKQCIWDTHTAWSKYCNVICPYALLPELWFQRQEPQLNCPETISA